MVDGRRVGQPRYSRPTNYARRMASRPRRRTTDAMVDRLRVDHSPKNHGLTEPAAAGSDGERAFERAEAGPARSPHSGRRSVPDIRLVPNSAAGWHILRLLGSNGSRRHHDHSRAEPDGFIPGLGHGPRSSNRVLPQRSPLALSRRSARSLAIRRRFSKPLPLSLIGLTSRVGHGDRSRRGYHPAV